MSGHAETAEVLLRAGISRDARTKVDRTPLHVAAQEGHLDIVDLLIRNGADIEAKDMVTVDRCCPVKFFISSDEPSNFNSVYSTLRLLHDVQGPRSHTVI